MSGFSADWLAMREPFDRAARAASAASWDLRALGGRLRRDQPVLRVLDLGCGTGANLRELAPRLGGAQQWLMVDHDARLLSTLPGSLDGEGWAVEVRTLRVDLSTSLDALPFGAVHLVTASALLDLVSASWLDALLGRTRTADAAMLFALTVDGRVDWEPAVEGDETVHALFTAHQQRDKGFGPSLGARAAAVAARRMRALGYRVARSPSDWRIDEPAMLGAMVEGVAAAALEQAPGERHRIEEWKVMRLAVAGRCSLRVGHVDLLASDLSARASPDPTTHPRPS